MHRDSLQTVGKRVLLAVAIVLGTLILNCAEKGSIPYVPESEPPLEPEFEPDVASRAPVEAIYFDHNIPGDEYRLIAKDIHALRSMTFNPILEPLQKSRRCGVRNF